MQRSERLKKIISLLQDGELRDAQFIADHVKVSVRTIYRDMNTLKAFSIPIRGTRGNGYKLSKFNSLLPLILTEAELEALNIGVAIMTESTDEVLRFAAISLGEKIDKAQPFKLAPLTRLFSDSQNQSSSIARALSHLPTIRATIKARQKLKIRYSKEGKTTSTYNINPLSMENYGRTWILVSWCKEYSDFVEFRLDLIKNATALPELFSEIPGQTLQDYLERNNSKVVKS